MTDGTFANRTQRIRGSLGKGEESHENSTSEMAYKQDHRKSSQSGGNKDARNQILLTFRTI